MNSQRRPLIRVQNAEAVTDGEGVKIRRSVAHGALHTFNPFLLLDEIASDEATDYIGGFPEHPHRGFETVTYMLEGCMQHLDHLGNEGLLVGGGVQWMTAGRGVQHSEMPLQQDGRLHSFQLWVNLPAAEKMSEPNYREDSPSDIPEVSLDARSSARVIAGTLEHASNATTGPVMDVATRPDYFDLRLATGSEINLPVASDKRVLLYVYHGAIQVHDDSQQRELQQQQLCMPGDGDTVTISGKEDSRLLVLAGRPIGEPIAHWGPFVMNTREEIEQTMQDYREGMLV